MGIRSVWQTVCWRGGGESPGQLSNPLCVYWMSWMSWMRRPNAMQSTPVPNEKVEEQDEDEDEDEEE